MSEEIPLVVMLMLIMMVMVVMSTGVGVSSVLVMLSVVEVVCLQVVVIGGFWMREMGSSMERIWDVCATGVMVPVEWVIQVILMVALVTLVV